MQEDLDKLRCPVFHERFVNGFLNLLGLACKKLMIMH